MARFEYRQNGVGKAVFVHGYRRYDFHLMNLFGIPNKVTEHAFYYSFWENADADVLDAFVIESIYCVPPWVVSFDAGIDVKPCEKYKQVALTLYSNNEGFLDENIEPFLEMIGMIESNTGFDDGVKAAIEKHFSDRFSGSLYI